MTKRLAAVVFAGIFTLCCSIQAAALPAYYSSETVYKGKLPKVRDQMGLPDCWSYAALGSAEYSMVVRDRCNFFEETSLFSEHHMAAAMNTTNDEDFKLYTRGHESGGGKMAATAYMARTTAGGPVLYKDFPESDYRRYIAARNNYRMLTLDKKQAMLTKARYITSRYEGSSRMEFEFDKETGLGRNIKYYKDDEIINKIKNAIVAYGSVTVGYYAYEKDNETYFNENTSAFAVPWEDYITGSTPDGNCIQFFEQGYEFKKDSNHSVMIVGWDDDYLYENFKDTPLSFDGESYTPENGAWIVKNSWGDDFGDMGFEYISYMDPTVGRDATAYELDYTANYRAYTHGQRGLMEGVMFNSTPRGIYTANRYTFEGDTDLLTGIGIYVCDLTPKMEIVIDAMPEDELKVFTKDEFEAKKATVIDWEEGSETDVLSFNEKGYYLFRLKEPIEIAGKFDLYIKYIVDETSSVEVAASKGLNDGIEYVKNVCFWADIKSDGGVREWKSVATNWSVNLFATSAAFETPKIKEDTDKVKIELYRYKEEDATVYLAFYKDKTLVKKESFTPSFDKYGYWETYVKKPGEYDDIKAFVWRQDTLKPFVEQMR